LLPPYIPKRDHQPVKLRARGKTFRFCLTFCYNNNHFAKEFRQLFEEGLCMFPRNIFKTVICLTATLILAACSSSPKGPNLKEGRWEITSKIEVTNIPFAVPPVTYSQCLTKADFIPKPQETDSGTPCDITHSEVNGDTVNWTLTCSSPQGKSITKGSITYKGDSFDGRVTMQGSGMPNMTQIMEGRRTGACN
jgi:hypothetical protein